MSLEELLPEEVREDGILLDPCKLTLDISDSGFSADELQEVLFERFNIQIEKSTFNTVTLLLTLGTTRSKVSRLHDAIVRLAKENDYHGHHCGYRKSLTLAAFCVYHGMRFISVVSECRYVTKMARQIQRWSDKLPAIKLCLTHRGFLCLSPDKRLQQTSLPI